MDNNDLDAIPIPLILIGSNEYVEYVNPPAMDLLGRGIAGCHYATVLRQPALFDAIDSVFKTGTDCNVTYHSSIGDQEAYYNATCALVGKTSKDKCGVLVSFVDVSQQQDADQMRSDFVANVSHELRSPLTSLLGFIETLRGSARDDVDARDRFLVIMEREARRMTRLVRDLLSLSRVEAEERVRPTGIVDISRVILTSIQTLKPMAEDTKVTVSFEAIEDGLAEVRGDEDQLQQVFVNLIENAIKYGGQGGRVDVQIEKSEHEAGLRGPAVRICITDFGEGIPQLHIPRLTERFYRIDSHRSREMGGTGLGLAIVKHIVNRHRGRLRISSVKGQGSQFTVILPAP